MASFSRVFLGWDAPLVQLSAQALWDKGTERLSQLLIVVPTLSSGRRLCDALVKIAYEHHTSILLPLCMTAEQLLSKVEENVPHSELVLAWTKFLINSSNSKNNQRPFNSVMSEVAHAESILKIKRGLDNANTSFRKIVEDYDSKDKNFQVLKDLIPENDIDRWRDLADLEVKVFDYLSQFYQRGGEGSQSNYSSLEGCLKRKITDIILMCHPDPLPLSLNVIKSWVESGQCDGEIWIHAPEEMANYFTEWGIPVEEEWDNVVIPIKNDQIFIGRSPEDMAHNVVQYVASYEYESSDIGICVCDENYLNSIDQAFSFPQKGEGWSAYRAAGSSPVKTGLYRLFSLLADIDYTPDSYYYANKIARSSFICKSLKIDDIYGFIKDLDDLEEKNIPEYSQFAGECLVGESKNSWDKVMDLLKSWERKSVVEIVGFIISSLDENKTPSTEEIKQKELLKRILTIMQSPVALEVLKTSQEAWEYVLKLFKDGKLYGNRAEADIFLEDWMEIPFMNEKHLFLCAVNEGVLPMHVSSDPLLPESLKKVLGVHGIAHRKAIDTYLFASLVHSRSKKQESSLQVFQSLYSSTGEPSTPSSLLMHCDRNDLPKRVSYLFNETDSQTSTPKYDRGEWLLHFPGEKRGEKNCDSWTRRESFKPSKSLIEKGLSPSDLNSFLACPFRFALEKMGYQRKQFSDISSAKELGQLIHAVMENVKDWQQDSDHLNGVWLSEQMKNKFQNLYKKQYGDSLNLFKEIQCTEVLKRFDKVGKAFYDEFLSKGWRVIETEKIVDHWKLDEDCYLNMRIDCVLENKREKKICVIDYKSSTVGKDPDKVHLSSSFLSDNNLALVAELLTENFCVETEKVSKSKKQSDSNFGHKRWTNLQLPMYILYIKSLYPEHIIEAGYFNIASKEDKFGYQKSKILSNLLKEAKLCACDIFSFIKDFSKWKKFPSAEMLGYKVPDWDTFSNLDEEDVSKAFFSNN